jgi:hypothetical protein
MDSVSKPTRTGLSAFPFLTPTEFHRACAAFTARVHAAGGPEAVGWSAVRWSQEVSARREVILPSLASLSEPRIYETIPAPETTWKRIRDVSYADAAAL